MRLIIGPVFVRAALLILVGVCVPTLSASNTPGTEGISTGKDGDAQECSTATVYLDVEGDRSGLQEVPIAITYDHAVVGCQSGTFALNDLGGDLAATVPAGVIRLLRCSMPRIRDRLNDSVWTNVCTDSTAMCYTWVQLRPGMRVKMGTIQVCPVQERNVPSVMADRLKIVVTDAPRNGEGRLELTMLPFRGGAGYAVHDSTRTLTLIVPPGDIDIGRDELSEAVLDFHVAMIADDIRRGSESSCSKDETPLGVPYSRMTSPEGKRIHKYKIVATTTQRDSRGRVVSVGRTAPFEFSFPTERDIAAEGRKLACDVRSTTGSQAILLPREPDSDSEDSAVGTSGVHGLPTSKDGDAQERSMATVFLDVEGDFDKLSELPFAVRYIHGDLGIKAKDLVLDGSKGEFIATVPAGVICLLQRSMPDLGYRLKDPVWTNFCTNYAAMCHTWVQLRPGMRVKMGTIQVCPIQKISVPSVMADRLKISVAGTPSDGDGCLELTMLPFRGGAGHAVASGSRPLTLVVPPGDIDIAREELSEVVLDFHAAIIADKIRLRSGSSHANDEMPFGLPYARMTSSGGKRVHGYTIVATTTQRDSEGRVVFMGRTTPFEFSFPTSRDVEAEGRKLASGETGAISLLERVDNRPADGAKGTPGSDESEMGEPAAGRKKGGESGER